MSIKTQCISPYFSFLLRLLKAFNDFNIVKAIVTLVDFYTVEKKKKKVLSFDFIHVKVEFIRRIFTFGKSFF